MPNAARSARPVVPVRRTLLLGGAALLLGCSRSGPRGQRLAPGAVILCLGDSLTAGVGAAAEASYPRQLAERSGHPVRDGGLSGDTAAGALQRLPGLMQAHTPALVLVSIGGNDFLRGLPIEQTEAALRGIVAAARATAQVALIAQPQPAALAAALGALKDHPVYARVADDTGCALHEGGWAKVLSQPELRADPIHANAQGYGVFVEGLVGWLRDTGFL